METDIEPAACDRDPLCLLEAGHDAECEYAPMPVAPPQLPAIVNVESLLAQAVSGNVSVDTLERLLALREKLRDEQARAAFFSALAGFQAECPIIPKTKTVRGSYSYSYAPLEVIIAHVRPIMQRHGLSVTFDTADEPSAKIVRCTVHHMGGHSETNNFRVPIDASARMNDMQKDASANTYGKRYAFCNALGIMTGDEDDDGNLGGTKAGETQKAGPAQPFTPPRRASDAAKEREPGSDDADDPMPADGITPGKVKRVYALIHDALRPHEADDAAHVEAIEAELSARTKKHHGRESWKQIPWKDYDRMCDAIPAIVDDVVARLAKRPRERRVRPRA